MWLKLIVLIVTLVNVKAVDNFIDENGQVLLQVPSRNEGSRYFKIQRGADGEMTGLIEVEQGRESFLPAVSEGQEQEIVKPLPTNTKTMLITVPEEQQQPTSPVLVEKHSDKEDDIVLVEIDNKTPPQDQPKENIIIETEPVKLPAPSPPKDVLVIDERPVQSETQPKPDPRPVIITKLPETAPRQIPQPVIIAPPPKPQPAPSQIVVIPGKQPEPTPERVVVIPGKQPEPTPDRVVVISGKQPEPTPDRVVVIPGKQPEPTPDRVVVIPSKQPEPTPDRVVVIPATKPKPKPVVNYIVKTPVQPEPASKPIVNVINNKLFDYECRNTNGYFALQNQCNRFVECKELTAYYYECPDGMNFNRNAVWPNYPCSNSWEVRCEVNSFGRSPVLTKECPSPYGLYALPDNECSNYIACHEGIATLMACPKGLVFNPTLQACDWLENVPSCRPSVFSGVTCPAFEEGDLDIISKYRYGQSCTEYIACHRGVPRLLKCDTGLAFDEQLQYCVAADRVKNCNYKFIS